MNIITIDGQIGSWEVDAQEIIQNINNMSGDITVHLNSVGGSVIDGISIYNALKEYDKGTVTVEIGAVAASIASYIALAGDKVVAKTNSTFMIHLAWLPAVGNYIDLRKTADISEGLSSIIANAYVAKTGMQKSEAIALMEQESFFFGAEMMEAKFVDEIVTIETSTTKAEAFALSIEGLKACNSAIYEHHKELDFEAVAKLLPQPQMKIDLSEQEKRERSIQILQKETECY